LRYNLGMALLVHRMRATSFISLALLAGCVDKGPGPQPKKIDATYVAEHLLKAPPADLAARLDVNIGDAVMYLGSRMPSAPVVPGVAFQVTHYWQVLTAPGKQWRVFSHVRSDAASDFLNADRSDMRTGYGPAAWRPGDIIEDVQEITLPPGWQGSTAYITVGLFQQGKHAISDRAPIKDVRAADHALRVGQVTVDLSKAPPPPGTVVVKKSPTPIVIDGVASEPAWTTATMSPEFLGAEGSPDVTGTALARMTWDDTNLYLFATVTDPDIFSEYKTHDDPLWKADCVEMFIDADGNRTGYIELQWNPNNARFDSWFATTRAQAGDVSYDSLAVSAVKVRGTADVSGDSDQGWDLEVAIPWMAMAGKDPNMRLPLPPTPSQQGADERKLGRGARFHLNVVRVDKRGDTVTASSWNRIPYSDFHALDRMVTVVFADDTVPPVAPGSGVLAPEAPGSGGVTPVVPGGAVVAPGSGGVTPVPGGAVVAPGSGAASSGLKAAPTTWIAKPAAGGAGSAKQTTPDILAPRQMGSATILPK